MGVEPTDAGALGAADGLSGIDGTADASKARGSRVELLLDGEAKPVEVVFVAVVFIEAVAVELEGAAAKLGGALAGSDGVVEADGMFGAA